MSYNIKTSYLIHACHVKSSRSFISSCNKKYEMPGIPLETNNNSLQETVYNQKLEYLRWLIQYRVMQNQIASKTIRILNIRYLQINLYLFWIMFTLKYQIESKRILCFSYMLDKRRTFRESLGLSHFKILLDVPSLSYTFFMQGIHFLLFKEKKVTIVIFLYFIL